MDQAIYNEKLSLSAEGNLSGCVMSKIGNIILIIIFKDQSLKKEEIKEGLQLRS